jgi:nitroimidazol reductase NimA-like FMN-containing flavoprotein (pyridoxamine 5'-phosphate oxidase superfamily)
MTMSTEDRSPQRIRELTAGECMDLLASVPVGRIAYDDVDGPIVIPVNHVVAAGTIVVRTSPASSLARCARGGRASFQADDLAERGAASWSVLVRGTVRPMESDEVRELSELPEPQAEGGRPLYLRITPRSVTGRRLLPSS